MPFVNNRLDYLAETPYVFCKPELSDSIHSSEDATVLKVSPSKTEHAQQASNTVFYFFFPYYVLYFSLQSLKPTVTVLGLYVKFLSLILGLN